MSTEQKRQKPHLITGYLVLNGQRITGISTQKTKDGC